jgi:hypothetical protein
MDKTGSATTTRTTPTTGLRVERIRVKTRWTKALGEAVTRSMGFMRIFARGDIATLLSMRHQGMV